MKDKLTYSNKFLHNNKNQLENIENHSLIFKLANLLIYNCFYKIDKQWVRFQHCTAVFGMELHT